MGWSILRLHLLILSQFRLSDIFIIRHSLSWNQCCRTNESSLVHKVLNKVLNQGKACPRTNAWCPRTELPIGWCYLRSVGVKKAQCIRKRLLLPSEERNIPRIFWASTRDYPWYIPECTYFVRLFEDTSERTWDIPKVKTRHISWDIHNLYLGCHEVNIKDVSRTCFIYTKNIT